MHVPFRFIVHSLLALSIVGAVGIDVLMSALTRVRLRAVGIAAAAFLTAAATANLVWMHYDRPVSLYSLASYFLPPAKYGGVRKEKEERPALTTQQKRFLPETYPQAVEVYTTFLDKGRLSWGYDAVHLKVAAKMTDDKDYVGETYLLSRQPAETAPPGQAKIDASTLSSYHVSYTAPAEANLVLNQNYFPGWKAQGAGGDAHSSQGVVAAPVSAGQGKVTFSYKPRLRGIGAVITIAVLIAGALFLRIDPHAAGHAKHGKPRRKRR